MESKTIKGSVSPNHKKGTWNYWYVPEGKSKRTSKMLGRLDQMTEAEAIEKAGEFSQSKPDVKIKELAARYFASSEFPKNQGSHSSYRASLNKHILPRWGDMWVMEVRNHPGKIKTWLGSLPLASMTRARIRAVFHAMMNYAMLEEWIPYGANPLSIARVTGGSDPEKKPWTLKKEEFDRFIGYLEEPFRTIAILSIACALRISEALALKWSTIDWLRQELPIRKAMVRQRSQEVKSKRSRRTQYLIPEVIEILKAWRQTTAYREDHDWVFASPATEGRLPWAYQTVLLKFKQAAEKAGIEGPDENSSVGTHIMRHTARTWVKKHTKEADVQRQLLGHSSVRITQDVYGEVLPEEIKKAQEGLGKIIFSDGPSGDEKE